MGPIASCPPQPQEIIEYDKIYKRDYLFNFIEFESYVFLEGVYRIYKEQYLWNEYDVILYGLEDDDFAKYDFILTMIERAPNKSRIRFWHIEEYWVLLKPQLLAIFG